MNPGHPFPPGHRLIAFCALAAALSLSRPSFSQTVYTTADTPYPLENLGHSPRASALGGAFGAVSGDDACLFFNPAGLDGLSTTQVSVVHQAWIADITQETLLAAFPAGKSGAFALSADYLDFGTLDGYDASGNPAASSHPFRGSLSIGWGGPMISDLSIGLAAHGIFQSLAAGISDFSSFFQAGALWHPFHNWGLGASYSFLGAGDLPEQGFLRLGASWSAPLLFKTPALLAADFTLPLYNVTRMQFGLEQPFLSVLIARLGYQLEINDNYIAGFRGLTCGLGFDFHDLSLDYSYAPDGDLGFSQMAGLTYRFAAGPAEPAAIPGPAAVRATSRASAAPLSPEPTFTLRSSSLSLAGPSFSRFSLYPWKALLFSTAPKLPLGLDLGYAPKGGPAFSRAADLPREPHTKKKEGVPGSAPTHAPRVLPASPTSSTPAPVPAPISSIAPGPAAPSPTPNHSIVSTSPPLDFNPSSTALPSDKVVKVETRFRIPDSFDSPGSASTPPPRLQKALENASRKVQRNPDDLRAWLELGRLYWRSGQPDFAVQAFTEALRLDPANLPLKQWLEGYRKAHP